MAQNMDKLDTLFYLIEDEKGQVTVYFKITTWVDMDGEKTVCNALNHVTTSPTLEALFLGVLYGTVADMEVSEQVKSRVLQFANRLYVEDVKRFKVSRFRRDMPN